MTPENVKNPKFFKSKISQWHFVAFSFKKIIFAETIYKTHK